MTINSNLNHIAAHISHVLAAEYGLSFRGEGDRFTWEKATRPQARFPKITSAAHYVAVCRRLAAKYGNAIPEDGRIIAVGWNHVTPSRWVRDGEVLAFERWWKAAVKRPDTVGSCYNPTPEEVYASMRAGLPAWACGTRVGGWLLGRGGELRRLKGAARQKRVDQAKALGRTSAKGLEGWFGADLWRRLGQLPALWQWAVVVWTRNVFWATEESVRRVRARDVDWERIRHMVSGEGRAELAQADVTPEDETVGIAYESGVWGGAPQRALRGWLCASYPNVPWRLAVRIARGETPVQLAEGCLSKKEAHEWLRSGGTDLVQAILRPHTWPVAIWSRLHAVRSPKVAAWLVALHKRGALGQLTRQRRAHGPGAQEGGYTFLDKLDEIQEEDLVEEASTPTELAFERAATRVYEAWAASDVGQDETPLHAAPRWRIFPRCMKWLLSTAGLVAEGKAMKHCVGSYAPSVRAGHCSVLSIVVRVKGEIHRSTVEFAQNGDVRQHRGVSNGEAPPLCQRALLSMLRANSLHWEW
jgi:hypothetical protein